MDRADASRRSGQGHVDRFGQLRFERGAREPAGGGRQGAFHAFDGGVDHFAGGRAVGGRQVADPAADGGYLAATAEEADAQFVEPTCAGNAGQLGADNFGAYHISRRCFTIMLNSRWFIFTPGK